MFIVTCLHIAVVAAHEEMLQKINSDVIFLDLCVLPMRKLVHLNGITHICRIWGVSHFKKFSDYKRDTTEVNMWYGMMKDRVIAPFSFRKQL